LKLQNTQSGISFISRDGEERARRKKREASIFFVFSSFGGREEEERKKHEIEQARYLPRTALSPFFPASLSLSPLGEGDKKRRG
jgi:hypothetical protein